MNLWVIKAPRGVFRWNLSQVLPLRSLITVPLHDEICTPHSFRSQINTAVNNGTRSFARREVRSVYAAPLWPCLADLLPCYEWTIPSRNHRRKKKKFFHVPKRTVKCIMGIFMNALITLRKWLNPQGNKQNHLDTTSELVEAAQVSSPKVSAVPKATDHSYWPKSWWSQL